MSQKFQLGQVVATPGCLAALQRSSQSPADFLRRHATGDWGLCNQHDWSANDEALKDGSRIFSVYETNDGTGTRIWVITEADRSSTCLLLPQEY